MCEIHGSMLQGSSHMSRHTLCEQLDLRKGARGEPFDDAQICLCRGLLCCRGLLFQRQVISGLEDLALQSPADKTQKSAKYNYPPDHSADDGSDGKGLFLFIGGRLGDKWHWCCWNHSNKFRRQRKRCIGRELQPHKPVTKVPC